MNCMDSRESLGLSDAHARAALRKLILSASIMLLNEAIDEQQLLQ